MNTPGAARRIGRIARPDYRILVAAAIATTLALAALRPAEADQNPASINVIKPPVVAPMPIQPMPKPVDWIAKLPIRIFHRLTAPIDPRGGR